MSPKLDMNKIYRDSISCSKKTTPKLRKKKKNGKPSKTSFSKSIGKLKESTMLKKWGKSSGHKRKMTKKKRGRDQHKTDQTIAQG